MQRVYNHEIESKQTQGNIFILYKKGIYTYIIFRQGIELERRAYGSIQIHSTQIEMNRLDIYLYIPSDSDSETETDSRKSIVSNINEKT